MTDIWLVTMPDPSNGRRLNMGYITAATKDEAIEKLSARFGGSHWPEVKLHSLDDLPIRYKKVPYTTERWVSIE